MCGVVMMLVVLSRKKEKAARAHIKVRVKFMSVHCIGGLVLLSDGHM